MPFTPEEQVRYSRQLALPELGPAGQQRLRASSALIVGAGGIGSPAALYLAAAGIGRLGLIDPDRVELSNLHRQILHTTRSIGKPKVASACRALSQLNPLTVCTSHEDRLRADNALGLIAGYDLVIDGSDNFATRYLVNDACVLQKKPLLHGSVFRMEGQATVLGLPQGPCYRCLFPSMPPPELAPTCNEGGVLGALPGMIGTLLAAEAIKLIARMGEPLSGRLLVVHALTMEFRVHRLARDPQCPLCGDHPTITALREEAAVCGRAVPEEVDAQAAAEKARSPTPPLFLDVREPWEWEVARMDSALHIPLRDLPSRMGELDPETETILFCHHGMRSAKAASLLRQAGFKRAINLAGGIDAWSQSVDPAIPRY